MAIGFLLWAGCARSEWPPAPRNKQEQLAIESAVRAAQQIDGWTEVACVVRRNGAEWHVQAWKIVNPRARGRDKCVPWAVRSITIDDRSNVTSYRNSL